MRVVENNIALTSVYAIALVLFLSPLELPGGAALLCVYAADMSSVENYEIRAYSLVAGTVKTIV